MMVHLSMLGVEEMRSKSLPAKSNAYKINTLIGSVRFRGLYVSCLSVHHNVLVLITGGQIPQV